MHSFKEERVYGVPDSLWNSKNAVKNSTIRLSDFGCSFSGNLLGDTCLLLGPQDLRVCTALATMFGLFFWCFLPSLWCWLVSRLIFLLTSGSLLVLLGCCALSFACAVLAASGGLLILVICIAWWRTLKSLCISCSTWQSIGIKPNTFVQVDISLKLKWHVFNGQLFFLFASSLPTPSFWLGVFCCWWLAGFSFAWLAAAGCLDISLAFFCHSCFFLPLCFSILPWVLSGSVSFAFGFLPRFLAGCCCSAETGFLMSQSFGLAGKILSKSVTWGCSAGAALHVISFSRVVAALHVVSFGMVGAALHVVSFGRVGAALHVVSFGRVGAALNVFFFGPMFLASLCNLWAFAWSSSILTLWKGVVLPFVLAFNCVFLTARFASIKSDKVCVETSVATSVGSPVVTTVLTVFWGSPNAGGSSHMAFVVSISPGFVAGRQHMYETWTQTRIE